MVPKKLKITNLVKDIFDDAFEVTEACRSGDEFWDTFVDLNNNLDKLMNIQIGNKRAPVYEKRNHGPFFNWLRSKDVDIDFDVSFNYNEGHGLIAKRDYEEGEVICSISDEVMMTNKTALEGSVALLVAQDEMFQQVQSLPMAMHLIIERYKLKSRWGPYITSLPKNLYMPLFWTTEQIASLKGSPAFIEIVKQRALVARCYSHTWKLLEQFEDAVLSRDSFTYEVFRWAFGTISCRKNQIPIIGKDGNPVQALALIPIYDLFNHENGETITAEFNMETNAIECKAKRDFKAGEQIYMFYGHRTNNDLIVASGFAIENNRWDFMTILFELRENDQLFDQKLTLLNAHNIPQKGLYMLYSPHSYTGYDLLSEELLQFLRVFVVKSNEAELLENAQIDKPLNNANEWKALSVLYLKIVQLLDQYPNTLEEDLVEYNSDGVDHVRKHILKLLIAEKEILHAVKDFANTEKARLK
eukprot:TRINITY_DN8136_c0_g1_i1.p1 TRINITY_DN8136_c0_g1~~TRINITY_DN8136_c0_g1_i1.p1  ORF type:complete len:471 (-),score=106.68 TRINITY_DN8136_c0_g1_i1:26-1438(-)